jgi:phospholipid transport system transporter-binding protein
MLLLPETVTLREARDTLRMLSQALQRDGGSALTVDASSLREFDSAAIAVLLECRRLAQAWGKSFTVHGAPAKLVDLARLYGVDALVALAPAEAAAA